MATRFSRFLAKVGTALTVAAVTVAAAFNVVEPAQANTSVRYSKNGISLNVNPSFGYKHGAILGSQYRDVPNDPEQLFNEIYINNDTFLIESVAKPGTCANAYQPAPGSTINFYRCDKNDRDMWWKKLNNNPYHAPTGLILDIGSQNNSVVRFSSVKASSQGSLSGTVPVSGKQVIRENNEYEYWLVSTGESLV